MHEFDDGWRVCDKCYEDFIVWYADLTYLNGEVEGNGK